MNFNIYFYTIILCNLLLLIQFTEIYSNKPRCGAPYSLRTCANNDTDCGVWENRWWEPHNCTFHNITAESARKCLGNRTLAFVGDSQIRDLGMGVALFLMGEELDQAPDHKVDKRMEMLMTNASIVGQYQHWEVNAAWNALVYPKQNSTTRKPIEAQHEWQIQVWMLYSNTHIDRQVDDVITNNLKNKTSGLDNPLLHDVDLLFWSYGLHDWGWWDTPPFGQKYYDCFVRRWKEIRQLPDAAPSVLVSLNPECVEKFPWAEHSNGILNSDRFHTQAAMAEDANYFVNARMKLENLPYWDAGAPLRSPYRCNVSDDGLHVKMFVDIMRAKMLFHHLCTKDMTWKGTLDSFL